MHIILGPDEEVSALSISLANFIRQLLLILLAFEELVPDLVSIIGSGRNFQVEFPHYLLQCLH